MHRTHTLAATVLAVAGLSVALAFPANAATPGRKAYVDPARKAYTVTAVVDTAPQRKCC